MIVSIYQPLFISSSPDKKLKFGWDEMKRHFFGGKKRESRAHIVLKHITSDRFIVGPSSIWFSLTSVKYMLYKVEIGFHETIFV